MYVRHGRKEIDGVGQALSFPTLSNGSESMQKARYTRSSMKLLMSQLESVKNLEKKQDFFGVLATKQFHSPGANAKL